VTAITYVAFSLGHDEVVEVSMRIMAGVSTKKAVCSSPQSEAGICNCEVPCPGYDSRENCPPLIVLAVLATQAEVGQSAGVPLATAV